jgi:PAS domain-containing protein
VVSLRPFSKTGLGSFDAPTAAALVEAAADLALIVDTNATVQEVLTVDDDLNAKLSPSQSWIGQSWLETLNQPSRARAHSLLEEAATATKTRWRHLNHQRSDGAELPMLYAAVGLGRRRVLLLGRDLRPMSMLQQRLIDAQQSMERDHGRIRNLELRYRLLLEESGEPMLVVNAATQTITEVNTAAAGLFEPAPALQGRLVSDLFEPRDRPQLDAVLASARAGGQAEPRQIRLADAAAEVELSASVFREDGASFMLLRAVPLPAMLNGTVHGRADTLSDPAPRARSGAELPRSVDQLTELIGRVPLKDLVREATDMIERLCIEAALEKTNDNRASAAELLGLSRQSLYVKLHRYGLGDLADAPN